jgi:hypothetical protein
MPIPSRYSLVASDSSTIDLARLALYRNLKERAAAARERYARLHTQVTSVAHSYFSEFPEYETVLRLRREIRIATRGVASDVGTADLFESGAITPGMTEQLFAAQKHLLKSAYRLVVPLVHPDRSKYVDSLFQQVQRAYEQGDLTFLQELYIRLRYERSLFWRQTAGIEFWQQEMERPTVSLRVLQTTPEFEICRAHLTGRMEHARRLARLRLVQLIVQLNAELRSLLMEQDHRGNQIDTT